MNDSDSLVNFLNQFDPIKLCEKICRQPFYVRVGSMVNPRIWTVSIERSDAVDPFLTQFPIDILTNDSYESNIDALFSCSYTVFINFFLILFQDRITCRILLANFLGNI